jgi:hypothetical protein
MKEKAQVKELAIKGQSQTSGIITDATKFTFRSRSADITVLVQMSREMWEFADSGELYFERTLNNLMRELFDHWSALSTSHSVKIVFFSRTYYTKK